MPTGLSGALNHRMDYLIARQGVVSGNIANASTPNYLSKDIDFKKSLTKATMKMTTTNGNHMTGKTNTKIGGLTFDKTNIRHDGNSVKIDEEMLKLSDIQLNFKMITSLYSKHSGMHKMAVSANRR